MAEKIRPPHLPPSTVPSQRQLLGNPTQTGGQQVQMSVQKLQQMQQCLHVHSSSQPDIALHTRTASSSVAGTLTAPTSPGQTPLSLTTIDYHLSLRDVQEIHPFSEVVHIRMHLYCMSCDHSPSHPPQSHQMIGTHPVTFCKLSIVILIFFYPRWMDR